MPKRAVLLMAYGSPDDLGDMEAYLFDIREGRSTSAELVNEMTDHYRQVGGSPLNRLTFDQAEAIDNELHRRGANRSVYVGMRHWTPWIKEAVEQMVQDGVKEAVAIVMAPHYSSLSIGKYRKKVEEALQELNANISFTFVESWWKQPRFLEAHEGSVRSALARYFGDRPDKLKLIFSAHSLPSLILKMGDPYDDQLKENAGLLAKRLGAGDWMFAYQSAGAGGEPWLGPALEEVVVELAGEGYKQILVDPIGFVCGHVEILYDIDIEAKTVADEHGIQWARTESMNTNPLFISAVCDAIEGAL